MKLVRAGAFVAVPLFRVNMEARGPHPIGSYEVWVPSETFGAVYGWLCLNRGQLRYVQVWRASDSGIDDV